MHIIKKLMICVFAALPIAVAGCSQGSPPVAPEAASGPNPDLAPVGRGAPGGTEGAASSDALEMN